VWIRLESGALAVTDDSRVTSGASRRTEGVHTKLRTRVRAARVGSLVLLAGLVGASALTVGCGCAHPAPAPRDAAENDASTVDAGDTPDSPPPDLGPPPPADGSVFDRDAGEGGIVAALCPPSSIVPTGCVVAVVEGARGLCNTLDDDCDGTVDEGCACAPGAVQRCFAGPPGRHDVGACQGGMQQCIGTEIGHWGPCEGGIPPATETCNGLDDDCNGCTDEIADCVPSVVCPGPGDPRVPVGHPFTDTVLHGGDFVAGPVMRWAWAVSGGPCDSILPSRSYSLSGETTSDLTFHPTLSGDYRVTFAAVRPDGSVLSCTFIVHVEGPGLRVEMCYPESTAVDLDLLLSPDGFASDWYVDHVDAFGPAPSVCSWADCEAVIRGSLRGGGIYPRADWGYANSPIEACNGGPLGPQWTFLGYCANPRLDIDNNLSEGIGVPENINLDVPRDGERFRIMVQNFTGSVARPVVNVYCGGHRMASYGVAPDWVTSFTGTPGTSGLGAMWRVADVTVHVDAAGVTTCDVDAVHPPGTTSGYDVTYDDPRF
jgi:hypothetical protein